MIEHQHRDRFILHLARQRTPPAARAPDRIADLPFAAAILVRPLNEPHLPLGRIAEDDGGMNQNTSAVVESEPKSPKEDAASRWRKLIDQQRESGLSVSVYCRERGISAASLFAWRRRLRPASGFPGAEMFKPVKLLTESKRRSADDAEPVAIESPGVSFIELCLPGERRLIVRRGFDRGLLLDLLDALEPKSSRLESWS